METPFWVYDFFMGVGSFLSIVYSFRNKQYGEAFAWVMALWWYLAWRGAVKDYNKLAKAAEDLVNAAREVKELNEKEEIGKPSSGQ